MTLQRLALLASSSCLALLGGLLAASSRATADFPQTTMLGSELSIAAPYHIATWAYDTYSLNGANASVASVNQLVDYAEGDAKSLRDCDNGARHCKAVLYLDAFHETPPASGCMSFPDDWIMPQAGESWYVHDLGHFDSHHRVRGKNAWGCLTYEMNPFSAGLQSMWRQYLRRYADNYDLYFSDNDSMDVIDQGWFPSGGGCDPWPHYCAATNEIRSDAAEIAGNVSFVNAMSHSNGAPMYFFYQQLRWQQPALDLAALAATNRYVGLTCEACVAGEGAVVRPTSYTWVLNEMAIINATPKALLLSSIDSQPNGSANQMLQRLVTTGIVWLGYSPGHTIVQPDLEKRTRNLAIWPEDLIYPASPLETMATGAVNIEVAPRVYRREFRSCYYRSGLIGHCAALVNANTYAVTAHSSWFRDVYHHVIVLRGGDVLSGGSIDITGARFVSGSTRLQAGGALLLAN